LGDFDAATSAYRGANLWKEALSCANLSSISDSEVFQLARTLAESLEEAKEFQAAATITLDYLGDIPGGAKLLCRAYRFADAIRVVASRKQPSLLHNVVDAGLVEGFNTISELLADCKSQIGAQVPRLRDLRVKKQQEPCKES
jgi:elongator complex protein 1